MAVSLGCVATPAHPSPPEVAASVPVVLAEPEAPPVREEAAIEPAPGRSPEPNERAPLVTERVDLPGPGPVWRPAPPERAMGYVSVYFGVRWLAPAAVFRPFARRVAALPIAAPPP